MRARLLLALASCFWGGAVVAAKVGVRFLPPFTLCALRVSLAVPFLLAWSRVKGENLSLPPKEIGLLAILGITGFFSAGVFNWGLVYTQATDAAIIVGLNPILTSLFASALINEPLTRRKVLGGVVASLGVAAVAAGTTFNLASANRLFGDFIVLFSTSLWAIYSVLSKLLTKRFPITVVATYSALLGAAFLGIVSLQENPASYISRASPDILLIIAYMAIFGIFLPHVWWLQGVRYLGAGRASIFITLNPLSAFVLSIVLLGEHIALHQVLGLALIIVGILAVSESNLA